jgi:hypothetical protein
MHSDSSRDSVRNLLAEAACHYQRAAEEADNAREAEFFRERAVLLEELIGHIRQPASATPAASPSVLSTIGGRPQAS